MTGAQRPSSLYIYDLSLQHSESNSFNATEVAHLHLRQMQVLPPKSYALIMPLRIA